MGLPETLDDHEDEYIASSPSNRDSLPKELDDHEDEYVTEDFSGLPDLPTQETSIGGDVIRGIGSDLGYAAGFGIPGVSNVTAGLGRMLADESVNLYSGTPNPPVLKQFASNLGQAQVDVYGGRVLSGAIKGGAKIGGALLEKIPYGPEAIAGAKNIVGKVGDAASERLFKSSALIPRALGIGGQDIARIGGAREIESASAALQRAGLNAGTRYNPATGTFDLLVDETGNIVAPSLGEYTAKNIAGVIGDGIVSARAAKDAALGHLESGLTKSNLPGIGIGDLMRNGLPNTFKIVRENANTAFGSNVSELLRPIENILADFGKSAGKPLHTGATALVDVSGPTKTIGFEQATNILRKIQDTRSNLLAYGESKLDKHGVRALGDVVAELDGITASLRAAIADKEAEVIAKYGKGPIGRSINSINDDIHHLLTLKPLADRASGQAFIGAGNIAQDANFSGFKGLANSLGAGGGVQGLGAGYLAGAALPFVSGPAGAVAGGLAGAAGSSTPGRLIRAAIGQRGAETVLPGAVNMATTLGEFGQKAGRAGVDYLAGPIANNAIQGQNIIGEVAAQEPEGLPPGPSQRLPVLFPQDLRAGSGVPENVDPFANGLPRRTDAFDGMALQRFMMATANRPTAAIAQQLTQKFEEAVRSQDRGKQQRLVADMAKLFPDVFEPGLGVDGKLYHPDDQAEYMELLKSAMRDGRISSIFLAKQQNAFGDKSNSSILPIENGIEEQSQGQISRRKNTPPQDGQPRQYTY